MTSQKWDMGGNNLVVDGVYVGATAPGQAGTLLSGSEIVVLDSVTPGTAAAGKAVVLDSGTAISGIKNNTYAAGTATVAPVVFTAGTNLTTAAAGALEFDGAGFYSTAIASARQQVHAEQYVVASANSATYNNTLLDSNAAAPVFTTTTSGTSAGAITVTSGKVYGFEFMYNLTNTGTTSHTWATAFGGAATFNAASAYSAIGATGTTAGTPASGGLLGFLSGATMSTAVVVTAASTSATEQLAVIGRGVFSIDAGGTIIPQLKASARPGASGTPGVVVIAGSYFRIWQLGSATFVGNWS